MAILRNLLDELDLSVEIEPLIDIHGLELDSRRIKKGDLFFAYPGINVDRRDFIAQAIQSGAVAILCESDEPEGSISWYENVPIIACRNVAGKVSCVASQFYGHPSREMTLVGITGTSGKTSCSQLLAQALGLLGQKTGVIGSIGYGILDDLRRETTLTSPDPISIQSILRDLLDQQVKMVTMETSSHALHQGRFNGVNIGMGIFTNLGRDHFDYHKDKKSYMEAKRKLFEMQSIQCGIFNIDDPIGLMWLNEFKDNFVVCGFSLNSNVRVSGCSIITAQDIRLSVDGLRASVVTPWGDGKIKSQLLGKFNVSNLLVVISALGLLGYSFRDILHILPDLKPILGRMQTLGGGDKPLVIIDNSHKPDALRDVLMTLREFCQGKLVCVFGCGGDRDRGKRPIMGAIAEEFADEVIITSDNLRFENPEDIIKEILKGVSNRDAVDVEIDRALAIEKAIRRTKAGDIILLAGKGHETYQVVKDQCLPFSEVEIVNRIFCENS